MGLENREKNLFFKKGSSPDSLSCLFLILLLVVGMTGCVKREARGLDAGPWPAAPAPGSFLTAQGQPATASDLAVLARGARYVLIGEGHTSPCDHAAQAAALAALAGAGLRPAIGLEMIPVHKQAALDEFNAGKTSVEELEKAVDWANVWGYDYALYAPIFAVARQYGLPLYAVNAPKELIRQAAEGGLDSLSPEARALLPASVLPPPPDQEKALREQFEAHKNIPGKSSQPAQKAPAGKQSRAKAKKAEAAAAAKPASVSLDRFIFVQSLWDTQMATQAKAAFERYGRLVVVLAGGGHVEYGHGIAHRLATLDPGAKVLSVTAWRGGEAPDEGEADAYYFCPLAHRSRLGFSVEMQAAKVKVVEVAAGSKADRAGMRPGDVIAAAGGNPAASPGDLHKAAIAAFTAGKPLVLTVDREGGQADLSIELDLPAGPMPAPASQPAR
jgi:uncharacterized iron-regulated protein